MAVEDELTTPNQPLRKSRRFQWLAIGYISLWLCLVAWVLGLSFQGINLWSQFSQWAVLLFVAAVEVAAWEAGRFPRLLAHGSTNEAVRSVLQLIGDIFLIPIYAMKPAEIPMVGYQPTPENLEILGRCPTLLRFHHSPWLRNPYACFASLMYGDFVAGTIHRSNIRRETVEAEDGGVVALDWWEKAGQTIEDKKKAKGVLFFGSTLTGEGTVTAVRSMCEFYASQGYLPVVMVKRGCGFVLPNCIPEGSKERKPKPWCLSGFDDMKMSIDHVARTYPDLPILAVGMSTGAAQLRHYVNTVGKDSKLIAAVLVDAGAEWSSGFDSIDRRAPLISRALATAAAITYKQAGHPPKPVPEDIQGEVVTGGLMEFACNMMAPEFGYERSVAGGWEYTQACTPTHASGCAVPILEMMTIQDMVLDCDSVMRVHGAYKASPHVVTVTTREGTHMCRWQGWQPRCWLCDVSLEFLEAALKVTRDGVEPESAAADALGATNGRQRTSASS